MIYWPVPTAHRVRRIRHSNRGSFAIFDAHAVEDSLVEQVPRKGSSFVDFAMTACHTWIAHMLGRPGEAGTADFDAPDYSANIAGHCSHWPSNTTGSVPVVA